MTIATNDLWRELKAETLKAGNSAKSASVLAAEIDAQTITRARAALATEAREIVLATGELAACYIAGHDAAQDPEVRKSALTFWMTLSDRDAVIQGGKARVGDGFAAHIGRLVGARLISAESAAALQALMSETVKKWPQTIDADAITFVRSL